jgi:hypothetical protein
MISAGLPFLLILLVASYVRTDPCMHENLYEWSFCTSGVFFNLAQVTRSIFANDRSIYQLARKSVLFPDIKSVLEMSGVFFQLTNRSILQMSGLYFN